MALKENFLNDVFEGNRKYQITKNEDGTYAILDVTEYTQEGDLFGAGDINATNAAVNAHISAKNNPHGVTAEQVGARPNTWMPSASDVGAMAWTPGSAIYDATTVLDVVNAMYTGGSFVAVQDRPLCTASDSPMSGIEFHYLVLQDNNGRKRVIAISYNDNDFIIYMRRTFNNAWIDANWVRIDDKFLPLSGGTLNPGARIHFSENGTIACEEGYIGFLHRYGGNISSFVISEKNDLVNAVTFTREGRAVYNIYGTHNVTCGTTEPTSLANGCIYEMYE